MSITRWPLVLCALSLVTAVSLALPSGAAAAKKLTPEQEATLERGELLVTAKVLDDGIVAARVVGVINLPAAALWEAVIDCGNYSEFMPRVSESRESKRTSTSQLCYLKISVPLLPDMWSNTEARLEVKDGGRYKRRWKMRDGTYKVNKGSWELAPWKGDASRTLVTYRAKVLPETSVPASLLKATQRRSIPKMFEAVEKRARAAK